MRTLSEIHAQLKERLAFGWEIYDEHWESHFVATFFLMKGTTLTGATYHAVGDTLIIPPECRARTTQTRLFE